ncbi:voltage-dependent calcium channel type A subunit alpha-1-like [Tachypleus tridentatus]|uniref:voltage-dependent calcium channel type A subunit alpha-1-like n=1 Tax=Tachypleus tridentatus TaxID=6853 RepID=UPI003FD04493
MIGAAGSRHLGGKRRGSSPCVSPHLQHMARSKLGTHDEDEEDDENGRVYSSTRLSIPELPQGVRFNRRRAVTTSDHKSCALVQTKFKGMTLEDVALRALRAEAAGAGEVSSSFEEYGRLRDPRSLVQAMAKRKSNQAEQEGRIPTSLFILREDNIIRRYTKFIIEWPYPFMFNSLLYPISHPS